jgi:hypothetical protein
MKARYRNKDTKLFCSADDPDAEVIPISKRKKKPDYAFNRLNLNKVTAGVVKGNEGSAKVLIKNGYKQYCTNPQDYYLEGKYFDTERFYKLQEWHLDDA